MACGPMDLNRYGDIIINMVLCSLIFFLTSVNIWWLFAQLITSQVLIFAWDKYRFLRESQSTMFATNKMDICGQYLMVLPCMILAGALTFKLSTAPASQGARPEFFSDKELWTKVGVAMAVHLVLHLLLLTLVVPFFVRDPRPEKTTFEEAAKNIPCNWFNANLVHCLRSRFQYNHDPPHIYDMPGNAHLHRVNRNIHAYYEARHFAKEKGFLYEVQVEVEGQLAKVENLVVQAIEGLSPKNRGAHRDLLHPSLGEESLGPSEYSAGAHD